MINLNVCEVERQHLEKMQKEEHSLVGINTGPIIEAQFEI